jgi:phosphatidylglycerophosphatase A
MNDEQALRPQMRRPAQLLAFGLGSGLSPRAPGTAGSLAALPIYLLLIAPLPLWMGGLLIAAAALAGIWICGEASRQLGVHDHGGIVWDEFVGMWIALYALPVAPLWWLAAFLLFRLFDILKPWPINWLDEHVPGGTGIMLDDIVAGLFAAVVLQVQLRAGWWA